MQEGREIRGMNSNKKDKKIWQLSIADDLRFDTAHQIGEFIASFSTPENVRRTFAAEYYLWKIVKNPAGRGFVSLAVDMDRIVGTTTVTRKKVWFRGQLVDAAEIGDTFTDPNYQKLGIFTALVNASRARAIAEGVRMIYGTPNNQSLPGYEKHCQFFRKKGLDLFLWVLPLRMSMVLEHRVVDRCKSLLSSQIFKNAFSLVLRAGAASVPGKGEVAVLEFDKSFDRLNTHLKQRYTFMLSRGADNLAFRLGGNPEQGRYGIIVKRESDHELSAVLISKDCFQKNMRVFFVADLFGTSLRAMTKVWNRAILLGIRQGYDLLAFWAPRQFSTFLQMIPAVAVPVARKDVIFYDSDLGRQALSDTGRWRFSILDSDNI